MNPPIKVQTNELWFLAPAETTGNVVVADTVEGAYDMAETAMQQFISYLLNDYDTNGNCGGMYVLDTNRMSVQKMGPLNNKLFGWALTVEFENKGTELIYDENNWEQG